MNLNQVKETLEAIGYPVKGLDWDDVLADLHCNYGAQKVGSSLLTLGDAEPLYIKSGNIGFMVDNPDDLNRACILIKTKLDAKKAMQPVTIKSEVRSRFLPDIKLALDNEVGQAERLGRNLSHADPAYLTQGFGGISLLRNTEQIIDDLLSDCEKRNTKAVAALKVLLIVDRGSESQ